MRRVLCRDSKTMRKEGGWGGGRRAGGGDGERGCVERALSRELKSAWSAWSWFQRLLSSFREASE